MGVIAPVLVVYAHPVVLQASYIRINRIMHIFSKIQ